jgi:hypothetical protein
MAEMILMLSFNQITYINATMLHKAKCGGAVE